MVLNPSVPRFSLLHLSGSPSPHKSIYLCSFIVIHNDSQFQFTPPSKRIMVLCILPHCFKFLSILALQRLYLLHPDPWSFHIPRNNLILYISRNQRLVIENHIGQSPKSCRHVANKPSMDTCSDEVVYAHTWKLVCTIIAMWFLEGIGSSRTFSSTLVAAALLESAAKEVPSEALPAADPIPSVIHQWRDSQPCGSEIIWERVLSCKCRGGQNSSTSSWSS